MLYTSFTVHHSRIPAETQTDITLLLTRAALRNLRHSP